MSTTRALLALALLLVTPSVSLAQDELRGARSIDVTGAPWRDAKGLAPRAAPEARTITLGHAADVAAVVSAATAQWTEPAHVPAGQGPTLRFLGADGKPVASGRLIAIDSEKGWACFLILDAAAGEPGRTVAVAGRLAWLVIPLLSADEGRPPCPGCGAERFAAPVVCGPPPVPAVMAAARRGEIYLGGDAGDMTYRWRCKACEHEWPAETDGPKLPDGGR